MKKINGKFVYEFLGGSGLLFLFFFFVTAVVFAGWRTVDVNSFIFSGASSNKSILTNKTAVAEAPKSIEFLGPSQFTFSGASSNKSILTKPTKVAQAPKSLGPSQFTFSGPSKTSIETIEFPLQCAKGVNKAQTCPSTYPSKHNPAIPSNVTCPSYFRWIHEDLRPWKETGITRNMVENARNQTAHFRLVIVDGKAYLEEYMNSFQTRSVFTLWGILQLLRLYPGRLPDLEIMFNTNDSPVVPSRDFQGPNAVPPPLFRYCSDENSLDIVFPDWSFWGWAEINIKPWKSLLASMKEVNKRTKWKERIPYAYWKGNPYVGTPSRIDLLKCNVSDQNDWKTLIYRTDWDKEIKQGFKQSNLEDQCKHRYKIYIEGNAWSVSEKYILACNSMTLYIKSRFHDFYIRGMLPLQHYWPIRDNSKCTSLKFAVEWGNTHPEKAEEIGEAASKFMQEDLKMDYVYDYMFHVLNEYAKLLKFKPIIPPNAVELCSETMACTATGTVKKFMMETMVMSPRDEIPCSLPPPHDPQDLHSILERKANSIKQVEDLENKFWHSSRGVRCCGMPLPALFLSLVALCFVLLDQLQSSSAI